MKRSTKTYFRSFYLTLTIILCLFIFTFGIAKAYENTVNVGFGKTKTALFVKDGVIHILDFEIHIKALL